MNKTVVISSTTHRLQRKVYHVAPFDYYIDLDQIMAVGPLLVSDTQLSLALQRTQCVDPLMFVKEIECLPSTGQPRLNAAEEAFFLMTQLRHSLIKAWTTR